MNSPPTRVVALRRHASPEEVQRVLLEEGHSRMPVYEGDLDHIVGYVVAKDLLAFALEQQLILLEDVLRPAYFVPETMRALDALHQMQARRMQMALIVDEQGGLSGLVTMEDLVEELVGEIASEHETPHEAIRREPDGAVLVDAALPIREVNRALEQVDLPEGQSWSTVGGLCMSLAGSIPTAGTRFSLPDGTVLEVVDASPRRVKQVRIRPPPTPTGEQNKE
jgi:putative hemolysin